MHSGDVFPARRADGRANPASPEFDPSFVAPDRAQAARHYARVAAEALKQMAALKASIAATLRTAGFIADAQDDLMLDTLASWAFAKGAEVQP